MTEQSKYPMKSRELALELYDTWVRERQRRPDVRCTEDRAEVEVVRQENFVSQLAEPRRRHLEKLKEVAKEMSMADKVALLVMLELPALEISTLLHRMSIQVAENPDALFFSKVNQVAACGCGCG
jgi:hypothetical protein